MFIGNVRKEVNDWKHVPMKVKLGDFVKPVKSIIKPTKKDTIKNMFQVLQADEGDDENKGEVLYIGAVEHIMQGEGPPRPRAQRRATAAQTGEDPGEVVRREVPREVRMCRRNCGSG